MDVTAQVVILWAVTNGHFDDIPLEKAKDFEDKIIASYEANKKLKEHLTKNREVDDFATKELEKMMATLKGVIHPRGGVETSSGKHPGGEEKTKKSANSAVTNKPKRISKLKRRKKVTKL